MTVKGLKEILSDFDDDMEIKLTDEVILQHYFSCCKCKYEDQAVNEDPCPRCRRLKLDYYVAKDGD